MKPLDSRNMALYYGSTAVLSVVVAVGALSLAVHFFDRKQDSANRIYQAVQLNEEIDDPNLWGRNFPLQFESYKQSVDEARTRYGGSEALPHVPTAKGAPQSKLVEDPNFSKMWAGYPFLHDDRKNRGHAFMLEDPLYKAQKSDRKLPGACLNCHASMAKLYRTIGNGNVHAGFKAINAMSFEDAKVHAKYPITCIDCHDPSTMKLRITRPAFIEGIRVAKAAQGLSAYDVNTQATREEMRSYVCAQCHVNYYLKGSERQLTFPWNKGLKADEILSYLDDIQLKDWNHLDTGAAVLKARHPEFEMWSQGIHSRSGVACADCHMPYKHIGAMKISDHNVRSPMLNITLACKSCHPWPEQELRARVKTIQQRTLEMRNLAMTALIELIDELKQAKKRVKDPAELKAAQDFQRKAQFLIDFVQAESSGGFHAPQETARILALALDYCRRGQLEAQRL